MSDYAHKLPQDHAVERVVLSAILYEPGSMGIARIILRGKETIFYQPYHQYIFRAACVLQASGRAIDLLSLKAQMEREGTFAVLEKATELDGGAVLYLSKLATLHAGSALETHCLHLVELATKRELGEVAALASRLMYDPRQDVFELIQQVYARLNVLQDGLQLRRPQAVGELYEAGMQSIADATQTPGGLTGIPSGLWALDKTTGGFQKSDLIIIAARPAMGKTTLALSIARFAAGRGHAGLFLTLEMGNSQLVVKLIATESGYTASQLRRGLLPGGLDEVASIREKTQDLITLPLYLDDTPALSISEFRAKAAKLKADYKIEFIISDYLQLMTGDGHGKGNREQEISSISRGLKLLAKELDVPVIALAQLSRAVETRGGEKKPQLSDLRESGAIEQDADMIIFPYRPEAYKIFEDEFGNSTRDTTELIIAKHRNGALDNPVVRSVMATGRYSDLDEPPMHVNSQTVPSQSLPASTFDDPGKPPF